MHIILKYLCKAIAIKMEKFNSCCFMYLWWLLLMALFVITRINANNDSFEFTYIH